MQTSGWKRGPAQRSAHRERRARQTGQQFAPGTLPSLPILQRSFCSSSATLSPIRRDHRSGESARHWACLCCLVVQAYLTTGRQPAASADRCSARGENMQGGTRGGVARGGRVYPNVMGISPRRWGRKALPHQSVWKGLCRTNILRIIGRAQCRGFQR